MEAGQSFGIIITRQDYTNHIIVTGPNGTVRDSMFPPLNGGAAYFLDPANAIFPGTYFIRFIPQGVASETIGFSYHNCNGQKLVTLTNGMALSASVTRYMADYAKFEVVL